MTDADRDHFREKLHVMVRSLQENRQAAGEDVFHGSGGEASGGLSNLPMHPADLGTDNFEQEVAIGLLQTAQDTLRAVAAALDRLEAGDYGRCAECGLDIPRERLDAVPYASTCIDCAARATLEPRSER